MALIKDLDLNNTGVIVPNAYHVISKVDLLKRVVPLPHGGDPSHDILKGQTGYVATIYLLIFASKETREQQKPPVLMLNQAMPEKPFNLQFVFDASSGVPALEQAYAYLKSLPYYQDAVED